MARQLKEVNLELFNKCLICFANTGKENPETLDFVHEFETQLGFNIVWLEYHRVLASVVPKGVFPTDRRNKNLQTQADNGETAHWFRKVDYLSASRKGEPFDELLQWMQPLPNVVGRACSTQLKVRTVMRYLFSLGIKEYQPIIGIRHDEAHRATQILATCDSFEHPLFPLIENRTSLKTVSDFWSKGPWTLNLKPYQGNCDLCFLKAKHKRIQIVRENPESVKWWKQWEVNKSSNMGNGKFFRLNEPYELIEQLSKAPQQTDLFDEKDQDIACTCAEKAFESDGGM